MTIDLPSIRASAADTMRGRSVEAEARLPLYELKEVSDALKINRGRKTLSMDNTPPKLREFARRLLAHDGGPVRAKPVESFQVFEKLRAPLVQLSGLGGFRSLLSRSLALASGDVPWLRALHIRADGSLEGLNELEGKLSAEEIAIGEVALAVQFIGLLVTFIGPTLTLQLLQDIWPKMEELTF